MNLNLKAKELSKQISNYYPSGQSHKAPRLCKLWKYPHPKSQTGPSQTQLIRQLEYLETIDKNIQQQQSILKHNNQILLMKIKQYYSQVCKKIEAQRKQIEQQLKNQFDKTFCLLQSYENRVKSLKLISKHDKQFQNTFDTLISQINTIQVPTIIYLEASLQSLDSIIQSMHPLIEFDANKQQLEKFTKKTVEQPSRTQEQSQCRNNIELSNTFKKKNNCKQQQRMIKTVLKGKQCNHLICEEQFEWGYKTAKTNKQTIVNDAIAEQSESKQNSLLQELC